MVKKQRQPRGTNVTKERYEIVKQLHSAGVTNTKIASTLGYSDTTISRMVRADSFEHYQQVQRDHAKGFANNQPEAKNLPSPTVPVRTIHDEANMISRDILEIQKKSLEQTIRIANALEALVEAWNSKGDKKKGLFS